MPSVIRFILEIKDEHPQFARFQEMVGLAVDAIKEIFDHCCITWDMTRDLYIERADPNPSTSKAHFLFRGLAITSVEDRDGFCHELHCRTRHLRPFFFVDNPVDDCIAVPRINLSVITQLLKENPTRVLPYIKEDPYYFDDFLHWAQGQVFHAESGAPIGSFRIAKPEREAFVSRLSRCARFVPLRQLLIYRKVNRDDPVRWSIEQYVHEAECEVQYDTQRVRYKVTQLMIQCHEVYSSSHTLQPYHCDEPPVIDPNVFNFFPGFKATLPSKVDDFTPILLILELIYNVYANRDMSSFRWIMSFLAQPIRYKRRTKAVLALVGPPESDLNVLFRFEHKYIYGELNYHFDSTPEDSAPPLRLHYQNMERLDHLENLLEDGFISSSIISVCSSSILPQPHSRIKIFQCNPVHIDIWSKIDNQDMANLFYTFLRSPYVEQYMIKDLEPYEKPPDPPRPAGFVEDLFDRSIIPLPATQLKIVTNQPWISSKALHQLYSKWCIQKGMNESWEVNTFAKYLSQKVKGLINRRLTTGTKPGGFIIQPTLFESICVELPPYHPSIPPQCQSLGVWLKSMAN